MIKEEFIFNKYKECTPKNFTLKVFNYDDYRVQKELGFVRNIEEVFNNIVCCSLQNSTFGNCQGNVLLTVRFDSVEILMGNKIDIYTTSKINHNKILSDTIKEKFILDKPIIFKTEADIDKGIAYVKSYIKEFARDYFVYWNDIRAFLPFLESENVRFLNDLLVGKGENRKLIIWKLCNHPKYDLFLQETIKSYEDYLKENPKDKSEVKAYKEFKSLAKRLEKTKPLYDWDASYLTPKPFKGVMSIIP